MVSVQQTGRGFIKRSEVSKKIVFDNIFYYFRNKRKDW